MPTKVLILSRGRQAGFRAELTPERVEGLLAALDKGKRKGTIDGVYGLSGGGLAAVITTEDPAGVRDQLKSIGIADAEIIPIRDAVDLLREMIPRSTTPTPSLR